MPELVTAILATSVGRCKTTDVAGDRLAQLGHPQVVRVEGIAGGQRVDRRLANEVRRHLVRFAEPESGDVVASQTGIGDFADLRCAQAAARLGVQRERREGIVIGMYCCRDAIFARPQGSRGRAP